MEALTSFLPTADVRAYAQTISVAEKIKRLKLVRMKRAINLALLSVVYQVLEQHVLVAEADDEYLHGDATVGWHPTWYGAESARLIGLVYDGMANAQRSDEWRLIAPLESKWREFE